ncbi:hypothetical protein BZA05DRAFT_200952 [Tricharina praecox]|uniref:uncharacterized protein n=1 Tax=Tricharina praecox TaxID=43433 RepID=UPI00221EC82F|nr:uncharacterized protein BZA05DRAFT_200952 [Tricharina praecox]KAI5856446.1 hypothetical protein BZA05DRAFT_200952 [Tricharina praecox]
MVYPHLDLDLPGDGPWTIFRTEGASPRAFGGVTPRTQPPTLIWINFGLPVTMPVFLDGTYPLERPFVRLACLPCGSFRNASSLPFIDTGFWKEKNWTLFGTQPPDGLGPWILDLVCYNGTPRRKGMHCTARHRIGTGTELDWNCWDLLPGPLFLSCFSFRLYSPGLRACTCHLSPGRFDVFSFSRFGFWSEYVSYRCSRIGLVGL